MSVYKPQPRQLVFHQSKADEILYGGCVSGDTEYLTRSGWKRIDQYADEEIAEWQPDGSFRFANPVRYINDPCRELIEFTSGRLDMALSPDHRVPLYDWDKQFTVKPASRLESHPSKHWIPVETRPEAGGIDLTDMQIRLIVAIHADGAFDGSTPNYCRMTLRKPRKRKRLEWLLGSLGIEWKEYHNPNRPTEVRYSFRSPVVSKTYAAWWGINRLQMAIVLEEMSHWDGGIAGAEGGDIDFSTTVKVDADFMQFVAHGLGRHASISTTRNEAPWKDAYRVNITRKPLLYGVSIRAFDDNKGTVIRRIPAERMYCFETSTGYWVARRNGKIFCTGNSAGGGKSYALRWDAIDFCINLPGFFAGLFRETLPMLEENHITFIREELGQLESAYRQKIGTYNETRKKVEFANGSILRFKHLEYDKDVNDIQGWELNGAYIDEGAQMSPYRLGYVKSRIRTGQKLFQWREMAKTVPAMLPFIERTPRFCIGSNPGGMSHHYLKDMFVTPAPSETLFEVETKRGTKKTRIFIPAGMRDNRYLDENYEDQFDDLPEWQQKQLRDGDWDVVPGAFFDCWSPQNVIKPFQIPDHWTRVWSIDWGFATPFWIGEFVISDGKPVLNKEGKEVTFPEECMIQVWEWYGAAPGYNKGLRMDAAQVAMQLKEHGEQPQIAVADESMWNHHDSGPSPAEKFANAGVYFMRADRERVLGWQEMYSRMKHRMLLFVDTCRASVTTIPALRADDKKPEDVLKGPEDHAGDGVRMACMARPYKTMKAVKKPDWWTVPQSYTFDQIRTMREQPKSWKPEII